MEQELRRNDFFLRKIFGKYVFASVLSMLATSVAGMIDTVLVGWFLGETGLAAMSLVSPVYLFYYTIGAVIGMGGSIAANLYIGKNNYDAYRQVFTLSFWMSVLFCVLTTAGGLLFLEPLVSFLGGDGEIRAYTVDYLRWYILGGSGTLLIYLPLNFLKMEGKPQISSFLFLLSSGLNVLFTWIFLSPVFDMGIKGASIGTALAMGLTALIGLFILLKKTQNTRLVKLCPSRRLLKEILVCGSPNGCNNLFNALKIMVINSIILGIGAAAYLPVFTLVKNVSDLMSGVIIGVASALMPIVGVYFGEKDHGSIRRVCRKALQIGGGIYAGSSRCHRAVSRRAVQLVSYYRFCGPDRQPKCPFLFGRKPFICLFQFDAVRLFQYGEEGNAVEFDFGPAAYRLSCAGSGGTWGMAGYGWYLAGSCSG